MGNETAKKILQMHDKMVSVQTNWSAHWQEVTDFIIPRKNDVFGKQVHGEKKTNTLYDASAIQANELLASALHGMLTNPSVQWFELTTGIPELDNDSKIRGWLQRAARTMTATMNQSNFQTEIHEVYIDLGSIGTATLRTEEDDEMIVRFRARPIYEHYVAENYKGIIDRVSREVPMSVRQILQQFKEEKIKKLNPGYEHKLVELKKDMDKEVQIVHFLMPKRDAIELDEKFKKSRKPFISFYVLKDMCLLVEEGFFEEFPYAIPRWTKTSDEVYGRGPGMKALPDIKMINTMMKTVIRGAQKVVDPALQMPDDGVMLPLKLTPGGINYYRSGTKDRIEPILTGARIELGEQLMAEVRQRIREAFFIDQLQLNEGPQMTAAEVFQRTEEKLRMMGPILGRLHFELLKPVIDRIFGIMLRKGVLPEGMPDELRGRNLEVQFSSMIARAQRSSEADNIQRVMALVSPLVQLTPEVMDNLDPDGYLKFVSNLFNVPQEIFRDEAEVDRMREGRAQAQQQQAQMQQAQVQAEVAAKTVPLVQ